VLASHLASPPAAGASLGLWLGAAGGLGRAMVATRPTGMGRRWVGIGVDGRWSFTTASRRRGAAPVVVAGALRSRSLDCVGDDTSSLALAPQNLRLRLGNETVTPAATISIVAHCGMLRHHSGANLGPCRDEQSCCPYHRPLGIWVRPFVRAAIASGEDSKTRKWCPFVGAARKRVWRQGQTCKQAYTGAMQTGLAEAWRSRVAGQAAENTERLEAEHNLASSLLHQGKAAEAEPMFRRLHEVMMRVYGAEDPWTLSTAGNLAMSLLKQGKYADAVRIQREVNAVRRRVLGADHPDTLNSANNLASSLSDQGKHAEAERIQREGLGVNKRVLGSNIRTRCRLRAIWLCPSQAKASTSTLCGSSARCMRCEGACSGPTIRTR
jgi:hypothetical protein